MLLKSAVKKLDKFKNQTCYKIIRILLFSTRFPRPETVLFFLYAAVCSHTSVQCEIQDLYMLLSQVNCNESTECSIRDVTLTIIVPDYSIPQLAVLNAWYGDTSFPSASTTGNN